MILFDGNYNILQDYCLLIILELSVVFTWEFFF